jgi:uncharacterized protein (TIGR03663 family)
LKRKPRRKIKPRPTEAKPAAPVVVETKVEDRIIETETRPITLPWLTVETFLYGLIFILALALRLWKLGLYPLSDLEAQQSLLALALYRGDLLEANYYSPLQVSLNALAFLLFGSSDVSARLASVLLGSALVILPLTLRRQLGPKVCLLASALLAISPVAVYVSRTLNSGIGVTTGALMIVSGFFNWAEDRRPRWLLLLAGGLALLLASGSMAYSVLAVFGLIVLIQFTAFKALWAGEETRSRDTADLRRAGIFFLVILVLLSSAVLFNLKGLGVMATSLSDWLSRFTFQPRPDAGFNAIFLLTIYEPLLVLSGLTGLALVILRRNLLTIVFAIWFLGLLLLDVFMAGRPNSNVILPLVPLAFLAAFALAELWQGLKKYGTWQNEGVLLVSGLVAAGIGSVALATWIVNDCVFTIQWLCQYFSWLPLILPIILFLLVFGFFWAISGINAAIRGTALVVVIVSLLVTINIGWRLNYGPLMHLAYQPLAGTPVSTGLVSLTETLADEASRQTGDKNTLPVTLTGVDSPALQWQLRDYRHLETELTLTSAGAETSGAATTIITADNNELGLGQPYLGQDFTLNARWSPIALPPKALIKWLIYRRADDGPDGEKAVLWLRVEE